MTVAEPAVRRVEPLDGALRAVAQGSPEWLRRRRLAAWDAFTSLPWPSSQRDEDWRRTDISRLDLDAFQPLQSVGDRTMAMLLDQWDRAEPDAAFVLDGPGPRPTVSDADALLAQGVIVTSLEDAAARHPELVQRALGRIAVDDSKFVALWNAMWRGGAFVHVPAGVAALTPVWVAHPADGTGRAVFPATVVSLDDGAALTVIDAHASPATGASLFSDSVALLTAGRDAHLDYIALQQHGAGVTHVATHRVALGANARLRLFGATLGAELQKAYWEVLLEGIGAEADIAGVCFASGEQHIDHQTLQAHRAPETRSDLLLKVAVRDRARSVYSGLIDVDPVAVHADGYVQNRNLLLTQGARADSVPRLEIRANDVRCGHGATAGHIDDAQRFYLMSRGVPAADAGALIVRAFLDDAVARVPHPGVRDLVHELLEAEIAGAPGLGPDEDAA